MPLLAAWGGIILGLLLAKACGIRSGVINLTLAIVGGVMGSHIGKKMNHFVKCFGTAFVGSFLTIRGIGMLVPQDYAYPTEFQRLDDSTSY